METIGRWLFRHRSFTALPLVILALGVVARQALEAQASGNWGGASSPGFSAGSSPDLWAGVRTLLSLILVIAGVMLRLSVAGRAPEGTSGRGRHLEARVLVTWGAYAYTRNPLYLGNLLICLGLLIELASWPLAVAVILFFGLQYHPVIVAEEAFLRERFGQAYDGWCARVPRFWPRKPTGGLKAPPVPPIRWGYAVVRDADTWFAALAGWWVAHLGMNAPRSMSAMALSPVLVLGACYLRVRSLRRGARKRRAV